MNSFVMEKDGLNQNNFFQILINQLLVAKYKNFLEKIIYFLNKNVSHTKIKNKNICAGLLD
jgi:hypothetical protein